MKTTKQIIDEYTGRHGPGLVPDRDTLWAWPPELVREELERRLNATRNDDSTPSLFD